MTREKVKIDLLHHKVGSEFAAVETILGRAGFQWEDVCLVRDDVATQSNAGVKWPTDSENAKPMGAAGARIFRMTRNTFLLRAALIAVALGVSPALRAQLGRLGRIHDFKVAELYEQRELGPGQTNQIKSQLTGKEAQPQLDGTIIVKTVRIEDYEPDGRTNLIAKAPECIVDGARHVAHSTNHVEVASANGQFYIEGFGFLSSLTNIDIIISNRVRTVIRRGVLPSVKP